MKRLFLIAILLLGATAMHVIIASHYDHPDGPGVDDLYINFDHTDINENHSEEKFHLFVKPNPSTGMIQISTGMECDYPVDVFNTVGVKVLSVGAFHDGTLDLTSLPAGVYFISVGNGTDKITKRIVVH